MSKKLSEYFAEAFGRGEAKDAFGRALDKLQKPSKENDDGNGKTKTKTKTKTKE